MEWFFYFCRSLPTLSARVSTLISQIVLEYLLYLLYLLYLHGRVWWTDSTECISTLKQEHVCSNALHRFLPLPTTNYKSVGGRHGLQYLGSLDTQFAAFPPNSSQLHDARSARCVIVSSTVAMTEQKNKIKVDEQQERYLTRLVGGRIGCR